MDSEQFSQILFGRLETIRRETGLSKSFIPDVMGISPTEYLRTFLARKLPPAKAIAKLAHALDLHSDALLDGKIDYITLRKRFNGDDTYISESYSMGAFSKMRTFSNILTYVEKAHGGLIREFALRRFQITGTATLDPDRPINILLVTDLLNHLSEYNLPADTNYRAGMYTAKLNKTAAVVKAFQSSKSPSKLYHKVWIETPTLYDRNCEYKITRISETGLTVESRTSEELRDTLHLKEAGSSRVCAYRAGIVASVPWFRGLPAARVIETKCVHRGDPCCVFEADFSHAHYTASRSMRLFSQQSAPL